MWLEPSETFACLGSWNRPRDFKSQRELWQEDEQHFLKDKKKTYYGVWADKRCWPPHV
jgi:hypothetical protein